MSDTPPYSEATVDLVVFALPVDPDDGTMVVGYDEGAPRSGIPQWGDPRGVARTVLDALAAVGRLLPEGAETNVEYAVRFISQGGSHVVGAERQQQAHALASHHSRLPGCCGEVLRLTRYVVEEVEATYPGRSAVPPEPKEGAGGQPSPA